MPTAEKKPKDQLNVRVPPAIRRHVDHTRLETGWDNGLQVVAGLALFECLDSDEKRAFIRVATRALHSAGGWEGFLEVLAGSNGDILNERVLGRAIDALKQRLGEEILPRRRSASQ